MINQNNFGLMSNEYNLARKGYPKEVFEYLKSLTQEKKPKVLDIGCGTGISTRQLKEYSFDVIGSDKDKDMIEIAIHNNPEIQYVVAPADNLPFESEQFDIVTAFTAFHWFNDEESLSEVKRILKKDGIFFAALKTNRNDESEYFSILQKYAGDNFDTTKNHFNKENLIKLRFLNIQEKSFPFDEQYTVDGALTLIRSLSLWNLVPENKKSEMLEELKEFYEKNLINGVVIRNREVSIITTFK